MDIRDTCLQLLDSYETSFLTEINTKKDFIKFVHDHEDCFDRDCRIGHVTGSALVIDREHQHVLLNHHRKLGSWIQFGGHADGNPDPLSVAHQEVREETGLTSLETISELPGIFDIDIHLIPAINNEPSHQHFDIMTLLSADIDEPYTISSESHQLKWIKISDILIYNQEYRFARLAHKLNLIN